MWSASAHGVGEGQMQAQTGQNVHSAQGAIYLASLHSEGQKSVDVDAGKKKAE